MAWWDGLNEWTKTIPDRLTGFKNKIKRKIKNFFLRLYIKSKTLFLKFINWFPERWLGKKLKIFIEITIYNFSFTLFLALFVGFFRVLGFKVEAKIEQEIVRYREGEVEYVHRLKRTIRTGRRYKYNPIVFEKASAKKPEEMVKTEPKKKDPPKEESDCFGRFDDW